MTEQEFRRHLELGHETNGIESKGAGRREDSHFFAGVVRAVLGMANRRDGGHVIIGVDPDTLDVIGLDDHQVAGWLEYDDLATAINKYASPSASFDPKKLVFEGRTVVVIRVHEFSDIPIVCDGDFHREGKTRPILRRGACYVRARHKPETSEIPSEEEMRELLELAIDKGVVKFISRAKGGSFTAGSTRQGASI